MDFEWDPQKAAENNRKHGTSFLEAASVLADPLGVTVLNPDHSYTERDQRIRMISARPLSRKERKAYEAICQKCN